MPRRAPHPAEERTSPGRKDYCGGVAVMGARIVAQRSPSGPCRARVTGRKRLLAVGLTLVAMCACLRPQRVAAVSPDGRLTARLVTECPVVRFASLFGSANDSLWRLAYTRVELVNNLTREG